MLLTSMGTTKKAPREAAAHRAKATAQHLFLLATPSLTAGCTLQGGPNYPSVTLQHKLEVGPHIPADTPAHPSLG